MAGYSSLWSLAILGAFLCAGAWILPAGAATFEGVVLGPDGDPVENAQVFIEPGVDHSLRRTETDASGRFAFEDVRNGRIGLFAVADNASFGGKTVTAVSGARETGLQVRLGESATVRGRVRDADGAAVPEARITRVALLQEDKVGIPLAKLRAFDFSEPTSDEDGRFQIPNMPQGVELAIKVGHPSYAQTSVMGARAETQPVEVTLERGVLVQGEVVTRGDERPVANALVRFSSAEPPHDTALAQTNFQGGFAVRLNPGGYVFRADGEAYASPSWQQVVLPDDRAQVQVKLRVAGKGSIEGAVRNARTEAPVTGARLILESGGQQAEAVRTGNDGTFELPAVEGENVLRLDQAPGYLQPSTPAYRVDVQENETTELPTIWLAPIPDYRVTVVDEDEERVPGAVVIMARPAQLGWHIADEAGVVNLEFSQLSQGTPIGVAYHPTQPLGALFTLPERQEEALVQLSSLQEVRGEVMNAQGRGLEGLVTALAFTGTGENGQPVLLTQTVSRSGGGAVFPGTPGDAPLSLLAQDAQGQFGRSERFRTEEVSGAIEVRVDEAQEAASVLGDTLTLENMSPLNEAARAISDFTGPFVAVFAEPGEAAMLAESLAQLREVYSNQEARFVLGVSGEHGELEGDESAGPVFQGEAPGSASVYLVNREGSVVYETLGLPSPPAIQRLLADN
ncbi:MAG: carboxypeptidase-like regulatory domain-containing protein [Candidatus Hydrogenedentota bacterium]